MYRPSPDFSRPSPVFTPDLDGLIKWLETQDPAKKYNLHNAEQCLWGQFHKAIGGGEGVEGWAKIQLAISSSMAA